MALVKYWTRYSSDVGFSGNQTAPPWNNSQLLATATAENPGDTAMRAFLDVRFSVQVPDQATEPPYDWPQFMMPVVGWGEIGGGFPSVNLREVTDSHLMGTGALQMDYNFRQPPSDTSQSPGWTASWSNHYILESEAQRKDTTGETSQVAAVCQPNFGLAFFFEALEYSYFANCYFRVLWGTKQLTV